MYRIARVILPVICFLLLVLSKGNAHNEGTHRYESEECVLKGVLVYIVDYGPPGHGDTPEIDKKERYFALELNHPIDVIADEKDRVNVTHRGVNIIQLIGYGLINSERFLNKRVSVKGTLFSSHADDHHTDVLMSLKKIKLLPSF